VRGSTGSRDSRDRTAVKANMAVGLSGGAVDRKQLSQKVKVRERIIAQAPGRRVSEQERRKERREKYEKEWLVRDRKGGTRKAFWAPYRPVQPGDASDANDAYYAYYVWMMSNE
jgi:hypothetical protein